MSRRISRNGTNPCVTAAASTIQLFSPDDEAGKSGQETSGVCAAFHRYATYLTLNEIWNALNLEPEARLPAMKGICKWATYLTSDWPQ